jgi:hypothetical protein
MKWTRTHPRPGLRGPEVRALIVLVAFSLLCGGCSYGFEGGGFPPHIRTIYIAPFENETPQFDLTQRLYQRMLEELPRRLGVRVAGEEAADAVLRGEIRRYDDVAQNYRPGSGNEPASNVISHEIQLQVSAQLVDVRDNVIRWEGSVTGRGVYRPDSQQDEVGKLLAIESLIEQMVDGAQSQW